MERDVDDDQQALGSVGLSGACVVCSSAHSVAARASMLATFLRRAALRATARAALRPLLRPAASAAASAAAQGAPSAAAGSAAAAPAPAAAADPYAGIATQPFSKDAAARLTAPLSDADIEVKPDGHLYLPEIKYRRILNAAFGPGGWALQPRGETDIQQNVLSREYALYCEGRFASVARGEQQFFEGGGMSFSSAAEAAKSNALIRCCKDLGIASELWDPAFLREWKRKFAVQVLCENVKSAGQKKILWRRADGEPFGYPWKEVSVIAQSSGVAAAAASAPSDAATSRTAPPRARGAPRAAAAAAPPAAAAAAAPAASSAGPVAGDAEELDLDAVVPHLMVKMRGRTWRDVLGSKDGLQYLRWGATNLKDGKTVEQIHMALQHAPADS